MKIKRKVLSIAITVCAFVTFIGFTLACESQSGEQQETVAEQAEEVETGEEEVKYGLTEEQRKQAYYDLVELQDSVPFEDEEWAEKQEEAYGAIAEKYGITEEEMRSIAIEGVEKDWPMPEVD
jgi:hypothetical protein